MAARYKGGLRDVDITRAMMLAARRAEFDFYQRHRGRRGEWFRPMPDAQLRAVLEAAIGAIGEEENTDPAPEPETEEPPAVEAIPARITPARITRALEPWPKR
jgi:hypothetical protein